MSDEKINGVPVTDEMIRTWADEAERGHPVEQLRTQGRLPVGEGPGQVIPVRMDAALLQELTARAEHDHLSRSEAIRAAVRAWISAA